MDAESHCGTKITIELGDLRALWSDLPDKKRMEVLKSVIWTAPDMHGFHARALKELSSDRFKSTLD